MADKRTTKQSKGFSAEERAAMRDRAKEAKSTDGEGDLRAKIDEMVEPDRSIAERIHTIVTEQAPDLAPRTWYGMPAYAKDGKVVLFFQPAAKFKARYATLGFNDPANLDDGAMWATAFAVKELTSAVEKQIGKLVKQAAS
jgi:uncharacterized protein YdhG (YjbR/CyaY superfamily)